MKILVNGAGGRIGKIVTYELCKLMNSNKNVELVAINEIKGIDKTVKNFQETDVIHGHLDWEVKQITQNCVDINNKMTYFFSEKDPKRIPFKEIGIELVIECSGFYGDSNSPIKENLSKIFLEQGVKKVIQTYPVKTADTTLIMGINHNTYDPTKHFCISNASCTTKAITPPLQILLDNNVEIIALSMDTTHAATSSQEILESLGQISTHPTGATKALELVIPSLKNKMNGMAYRVPTQNGSFANLYIVVSSNEELNSEKINSWIISAVKNNDYYKRVGLHEKDEAGTKDIIGRRENAVIILSKTNIIPLNFSNNGKKEYLITLISGYDNELGSAVDSVLLTDFISSKE